MRKFYFAPCLLFSLACHAQQYNATAFNHKIKTLRIFLDKNHYSPLRWNDSASLLLYNRWMNILDDDKMYFTKTDIDVLGAYKTKLDDEMNGGEMSFFNKSIQLYKKAVRLTDSLQKLVLAKPADFSKPDALHYPFTDYAVSNAELQQRLVKLTKWRILHSIAVQNDSNENAADNTLKMPVDFAVKEIKAREKLKHQHEINIKESLVNNTGFEEEMDDKYLQAISWCYDPHTQYMNLAEKKGFETELSGFE